MNAGQMFMNMMSGVTQTVTPDAMAAVPLNKSGVNFDNLLGEIRMQADAKMVANVDIAGVYAVSEEPELPSETSGTVAALKLGTARTSGASQANGEIVMLEAAALDTLIDGSSDALPITPEMYPAEAQMVLAAYAQSSMIPHVNTPPSHEDDSGQNVLAKAVEVDRSATRTGAQVTYLSEVAAPEQPSVKTADLSTSAKETATQQSVPVIQATARQENHPMSANAPVVKSSGQNQAADVQQPGRMPSVNTPPNPEVDSVQNVLPKLATMDQLKIKADAPVTSISMEQLQSPVIQSIDLHPPRLETVTQAASVTTAKPAAPYQAAILPAVEVAASKPETARQEKPLMPAKAPTVELSEQNQAAPRPQPGRMPSVNTPSSQEVDFVQNVQPKAAVTDQPIIKIEAPVMFRTSEQRQSSSTQSVEQYSRTVHPEQQTARLESVASPTTDRPVAKPAEQTHRFAVAAPEQPLTNPTVISVSAKETATQQSAAVITAKPAEPASASFHAVTTPVVEVATAKPETARQEKPLMPAKAPTVELSEQNQATPRPQPGRMPSVNTPSSQEVDSVQNVQPKAAVTDQPIIKTEAPVTFRSSEQRQPSTTQSVEQYTRTVQPEQQTARLESVASPTTDRPVAKPAEQTHRLAVAAPEQPLTNPTVISVSAKETATQQSAPVITAKPAEPASVLSQAVTTPVVEVATAKPETARREKPLMAANAPVVELYGQTRDANIQQPDRMPSVNTPPSHEVDTVLQNQETNVAADLNQVATGLQTKPGRESAPVRNEAESLSKPVLQVTPLHQSGLETFHAKEAAKPVVQETAVPEPPSEVSQETRLPNRAISTSSEPEIEFTFTLPRPITVSKAHSTEPSRLASTSTALRQQIISLDIEPSQKQTAELGTVTALKLETIVTPSSAARAQENGRTPEAVLSSATETGLTRKLHPEVTLKEIDPGSSVAKTDETNKQKASSDSHSGTMQQMVGRAAIQAIPSTDGENARASLSPSSAKGNGTPIQSIVPSGEVMQTSDDSMGSNGDQAGSGPKPDNQMLAHQVNAQTKPENQPVASVHGSRFNPEQSRQDLPEQVVHQVRERLGQHEVKAGNQQITLTLSPENMGELKMNLNLQGQRLSVEIVTENRTVRDAILQHSDSLKETLARQNITVESFDVTTNGRGTGNPGQNQDAWRELARQKQQQLWASTGGYALPQMNVSLNPAAYQAKNEHAMLDIHY
ncbi:MAG TPA: hypothetical protein DCZ63_13185 [Geobacter sp.]|nr:hypothetical protein [Geobacter sp.]